MELIQMLVDRLGVREEQAKGGAGLLFQLAQKRLNPDEFNQIASTSTGIDDFINEAPESGGIMGKLEGAASAFGGKIGGMADMAHLAAGFSKLGLDKDMVGKFIPIVLSFIQNQGGDTARNLMEKIFSASKTGEA
jgi:hypothetical protein